MSFGQRLQSRSNMGRNTLEPKVEDRKKFDIDLQYGQVREKIVADMLQDKKIEVKSESYGKPSGINATDSDYWFHNLCVGDQVFTTLVFETKMLKKIINESINANQVRSVSGGDHNASKMYLMNIQNLFSQSIIKKSVDNNNTN